MGGDKFSSLVPFLWPSAKCQAAEGFWWHVVEVQLDFPSCMKGLQAHSLVHFCCISLRACLCGTLYVLRIVITQYRHLYVLVESSDSQLQAFKCGEKKEAGEI